MSIPAMKWTDEETDDAIMGAGCTWTYSWYGVHNDMPDGKGVVIEMEDPTGEENLKQYNITYAKMRRVAIAIAMGKHNVNDEIVRYIKNDDLDSDAADCVLQICAYGELVFS